MTTATEICNIGLTLIGEGRVTSSFQTAPVNEVERLCQELYDITRRAALQKDIWVFAKSRATLAAHAKAPAFEWDNAFPVPSGFLRFLSNFDGRFWTPLEDADYTLEAHPSSDLLVVGETSSQCILTNYDAPLQMSYVFDNTDEDAMPPTFIETVAASIAMKIALRLTDDKDAYRVARDAHKTALDDAARINAIQLPPIPLTESSLITVRA